jgi:membrane-anchored protein YejM (alkaline phosphatase superfamily)
MSLVVLVSIDGLRPDALTAATCPNLTAFKSLGAYILDASSVFPSLTLPCHTSMFYSVPPQRHGILTNNYTPMARPLPGLFETAAAAGLRCAAFFGWEQLRDLGRPGSLALSYCLNTCETDLSSDQVIAGEAGRHLAHNSFDFAFVYFGTVDTAGHNYGWMSPEYLAQLEQVDQHFGTLLQALPDDAHVLVQSDHGGHDHTHGTDSPEDITIPWMITGPYIRKDHAIAVPVNLLDTAPTLARLLGLASHPQWEGLCVEEVFESTIALPKSQRNAREKEELPMD